jgi:RimJ/RimL family protein N-acetyltransferase
MAKLQRGIMHMQIHMKFQPYNDETMEEQLKYFQYIYHRLKDLGYQVKGDGYLNDLKGAITATIDLEDKYFGVADTGIVGYSFASAFKGMHLMSLKRMADYFDELVINKNKTLRDDLYRLEFHERYRKPKD